MENSADLLILPAFGLMWLAVSQLLAWLGGWQKLAARYPGKPTEEKPLASSWMASGSLGWANYNNCLSARLYRDHLRLQTWFLFRFGHQPLDIPRSVLQAGEYKTGWFGFHYFKFAAQGVRVTLGGSIASQLRDWIKDDDDVSLPRRVR